ncbi:energy coupling factor transporter S component ThiW [Lachnospiraceae bacterium 54-53]
MNNQTQSTVHRISPSAARVRLKKLVISGMLTALTVALSGFSIPIGASRCFPMQHLANVLAGVFLGPVYGVSMAFGTSLIRNLLGTGSLLAFPGSMAGAFLGAVLYRKTGRLLPAYLGEVMGTGLIGGTLCYPVAVLLMGKEVAVFFFVVPFLLSTAAGTILAALLLEMLRRLGLFTYLSRLINE